MSPERPPEARRSGPMFHAEQNLADERRQLRSFSEPPKVKAAGDLQERGLRLTALAWSPAGLIIGGLAGLGAADKYGLPGIVILVGAALGWALVYYLPQLITHMGGSAAGSIYNPSGRTTPREKEYSYEESLVSRGLYDEAATAFELAALENPTDPKPYLRLARILRDHLGRYEDAARWLRRVQRDAQLSPGQAFLARKELVELYWHKMGEPAKAAPDLARMAEELAGTPEGEWAADELRDVKEIIAREREG